MKTVRWFGRKYAAPVYNDCPEMPVPVGSECQHCNEEIAAGEDGFCDAGDAPFHRACFLRMIYGSISHQTGMCRCFHEGAPDPVVTMSLREEAEAAVRFHEQSCRSQELHHE